MGFDVVIHFHIGITNQISSFSEKLVTHVMIISYQNIFCHIVNRAATTTRRKEFKYLVKEFAYLLKEFAYLLKEIAYLFDEIAYILKEFANVLKFAYL